MWVVCIFFAITRGSAVFALLAIWGAGGCNAIAIARARGGEKGKEKKGRIPTLHTWVHCLGRPGREKKNRKLG